MLGRFRSGIVGGSTHQRLELHKRNQNPGAGLGQVYRQIVGPPDKRTVSIPQNERSLRLPYSWLQLQRQDLDCSVTGIKIDNGRLTWESLRAICLDQVEFGVGGVVHGWSSPVTAALVRVCNQHAELNMAVYGRLRLAHVDPKLACALCRFARTTVRA